MESIPDALGTSDVVVLACPLTDETAGLAGSVFFAAMKPGSLLINIGRGGLVDEAALLDGLASDRPRRAVLDVFATQPLPTDSPLWTHPQVRVSAHTAASGSGTMGRGDTLFLENLHRLSEGRPLRGEVDARLR
jgi:phosphoglycerate dehydrogenase-like enzyme